MREKCMQSSCRDCMYLEKIISIVIFFIFILARLYSIQYSWDHLSYCAFLPLRHRWWCCWRSWWRERDDSGGSRCWPRVASPWCHQTKTSAKQNIVQSTRATTSCDNFLWQLLVTTSCNYFLCLLLISTSRSNIASIFLFFLSPPFPFRHHVSQHFHQYGNIYPVLKTSQATRSRLLQKINKPSAWLWQVLLLSINSQKFVVVKNLSANSIDTYTLVFSPGKPRRCWGRASETGRWRRWSRWRRGGRPWSCPAGGWCTACCEESCGCKCDLIIWCQNICMSFASWCKGLLDKYKYCHLIITT